MATGGVVVAAVATWVAVATVVSVVAVSPPWVAAAVAVVVVVAVAVAAAVAAVASSWAWAVPEDGNSCCFPAAAFPVVAAAGGTLS